MLDAMDSVEWTRLKHAYGSAGDSPEQIRALLSEDAEARENAMEALWSSLCHQGTVYEATMYAVPFLLELLSAPEVQDKAEILGLLAGIANGGFHDHYVVEAGRFLTELDTVEAQHEIEVGMDLARRTHAAVREGCDIYLRLLDDLEIETRRAALLVLVACLRSDAARVAPALRRRFTIESDRVLRASLIRCLAMFTPIDNPSRELLARTHTRDKDLLMQLAAASALAHADGAQAPEGVEQDLADALTRPDLAVANAYSGLIDEGGWVRKDYVTDLALALKAMAARGISVLPLLTEALDVRCAAATLDSLPPGHLSRSARSYIAEDGTRKWLHVEGMGIYPPTPELQLAEALLTLTFGKRRSRQLAPVVPSREQRIALEALSACDAIWHFNANMDSMLNERGLPFTRAGLLDYLARAGS